MPRINLDDDAERWRYRCPSGHTQWRAINGGFYCKACAESWEPGTDPAFGELTDMKSDETYPRAEVEFVAEHARHFQAEYAVEEIVDGEEEKGGTA